MEKRVYEYTGPDGKKIKVPVKVNSKLKSKKDKKVKEKKEKTNKSELAKKIATGALVLSIGTGVVLGGAALWNKISENEPTAIVQQDVQHGIRFNPNGQENIVDKAVFLIEDAAKAGHAIDAEDAVLAVIVANSNEITPGFMGQLFGEKADQKYTYGQLVDAFLRVGMMESENIGVATDDELAINTESIFASEEDYAYLSKIRSLTARLNSTTDETEKASIAEELNKLAFDLCTYEAYDISSPAGVFAMLSLDGMRTTTNTNSKYTVLPDDIRDEMFGDGDYSCRTESTFITDDGQVLQTHYSYRVNDLKLDSVKSKLDDAVLKDGKTVILDDIIAEVTERTKDVVVSDFNVVDAINETMEANRNITYEYEASKGVVKPNYSPKTSSDKVTTVNGKEVIVGKDNTSTAPTGKTQSQAQAEVDNKAAVAQAEANKGAADGKYYGENGLAKPSLSGKSDSYVKAFNVAYDAYKAVYDAKHSKQPDEVVSSEFVPTNSYTNNSSYNNGYKNNHTNNNNNDRNTSRNDRNTNSYNDRATSSNRGSSEVVSSEFIPLDGLSKEELRELERAAAGETPIYTDGKTR